MGTTVATLSINVTIQDGTDEFVAQQKLNVKNALKAMADATVQRAQMLAPMSKIKGHAGTLRATGVVEVRDDGYETAAQFGNGIAYARYQEYGGYGDRRVRNYTTPGTQSMYLLESGDSVSKEGIKNYL